MPVHLATPADRDALLQGVQRRPWFAAPNRAFEGALIGRRLHETLERQVDLLIDHPAVDVLVDDGGWAIVQHEVEESVTGNTISLVRDPSWIRDPSLIREAASRARARGSCRLGIDVYVDDRQQGKACAEAGMTPEYHRIVCDLERAPAPAATDVEVGRARLEDRLFLVALSTECVPFMFCADRQEEIELVRRRFFDVYGVLDLAGDDDLAVWVARVDGEPGGAILVRPHAERAADEEEEAYIYDISVLPAQWGSGVAVALVDHLIQEMRGLGIKYLTGDISVDNARVLGLSRRFRFEPEHTRHFLKL